MNNEICPCCGRKYYREYSGEYDIPDENGCPGIQLSPDTGHCRFCGFDYSQHCQHPMEEQIDRYKEYLRENYKKVIKPKYYKFFKKLLGQKR